MSLQTPRREKITLVLQGGGALGSYQAGVYEALEAASLRPTWVAGISIGAINAALIAGNPPERRVERLHDFWRLITSNVSRMPMIEEFMEAASNQVAALTTLMFGAPGFFTPRALPPFTLFDGGAAALSYYDSSELKGTLERLVDFDRLNDGSIRCSVGAVNIRSGNFVYFDTSKIRIGPEHIMASGALPPGLPPVEVDGEYYWDGGLVSNTPLQYVIDEDGPDDLLAFQVDLFSARGPMPRNLIDAAEREKDIRFSSRTRLNTDFARRRQAVGAAAERLSQRLPPEWQQDPDVRLLASQACASATSIVHLIYKSKIGDGYAKDYEFSRASMQAHWAAGREDVRTTLQHPDWLHRGAPEPGSVRVFDLANPTAAAIAAAAAAATNEDAR